GGFAVGHVDHADPVTLVDKGGDRAAGRDFEVVGVWRREHNIESLGVGHGWDRLLARRPQQAARRRISTHDRYRAGAAQPWPVAGGAPRGYKSGGRHGLLPPREA